LNLGNYQYQRLPQSAPGTPANNRRDRVHDLRPVIDEGALAAKSKLDQMIARWVFGSLLTRFRGAWIVASERERRHASGSIAAEPLSVSAGQCPLLVQ